MIPKNPSQQLLKAYYNLLNGSIIYDDTAVTIGTKIPRRTDIYIYLYISSIANISTGDNIIYSMTVTMQIVSRQGVNEGDETILNSILDQVLSFVGDADSILMDDFRCLMSNFGDMDSLAELDESNTVLTKKLNMINFIEQK
jgi:hypothetical protein